MKKKALTVISVYLFFLATIPAFIAAQGFIDPAKNRIYNLKYQHDNIIIPTLYFDLLNSNKTIAEISTVEILFHFENANQYNPFYFVNLVNQEPLDLNFTDKTNQTIKQIDNKQFYLSKQKGSLTLKVPLDKSTVSSGQVKIGFRKPGPNGPVDACKADEVKCNPTDLVIDIKPASYKQFSYQFLKNTKGQINFDLTINGNNVGILIKSNIFSPEILYEFPAQAQATDKFTTNIPVYSNSYKFSFCLIPNFEYSYKFEILKNDIHCEIFNQTTPDQISMKENYRESVLRQGEIVIYDSNDRNRDKKFRKFLNRNGFQNVISRGNWKYPYKSTHLYYRSGSDYKPLLKLLSISNLSRSNIKPQEFTTTRKTSEILPLFRNSPKLKFLVIF